MPLRHLAERVRGWSRFQPDRGFEFNGTALVADDGLVLLVDPVPPSDEEVSALRKLGSRFEVVLLNAHHERDAARVASMFDAIVRAPRADLPLLKNTGARPFDDGDRLGGGWVVKTLDDHKTPGESALWHAGHRQLLIGDAVLADPLTGLRLPPPAMLRDRQAALAGLSKLVALDFDALFTGDGFVLPGGGREALRRFLEREQGERS